MYWVIYAKQWDLSVESIDAPPMTCDLVYVRYFDFVCYDNELHYLR